MTLAVLLTALIAFTGGAAIATHHQRRQHTRNCPATREAAQILTDLTQPTTNLNDFDVLTTRTRARAERWLTRHHKETNH